ncbi:MAG TPA: TDP-N-acetylfucosamine:lipid II N-acetylfucosaminyltransferase [Sedimentisphaerales bacterium]|jgi:hypothetical protein|nr:TDP-N-acetylfucosamine:lipid II N-acetylfucosaminyltransferase [Sedimentisphaerales bacterium]HNU29434.1 TDP-N-acetylfucosamine:lipid II N-acetylfucosaminyltransferase [Sedimentisphaerales bacterium]
MIYHVLPGNCEHLVPAIIVLLKEHTDGGADSQFLIFCTDVQNERKYESCLEKGAKIVFLRSPQDLASIVGAMDRRDSLVLHSILHGRLWDFLFRRPRLCRQAAWVAWGGDFHYDGFLRPRGLRQRLRRWKRGVVARRLRAICTLVPGDYDLIAASLGCAGNYFRVSYSLHSLLQQKTPSQWFDPASAERPLRVLVGNSAAPTNRHVPVLEALAPHRQENMEIWCPLSYAEGDPAYATQVVERGREVLGDRFKPMMELMPKEQYAAFLDSIDILVFNHSRQQGLFNLNYMLFQGKKVFLRPETTTYAMLKELGIEVGDTDSIATLSFREFASMEPSARQRNIELAQQHLSMECAADQWNRLFAFLRRQRDGRVQ